MQRQRRVVDKIANTKALILRAKHNIEKKFNNDQKENLINNSEINFKITIKIGNYKVNLKASIDRFKRSFLAASKLKNSQLSQNDVIFLQTQFDDLYEITIKAYEFSLKNNISQDIGYYETFAANMNNLAVSTSAIIKEQHAEESYNCGGFILGCLCGTLGWLGIIALVGAVLSIPAVCCYAIITSGNAGLMIPVPVDFLIPNPDDPTIIGDVRFVYGAHSGHIKSFEFDEALLSVFKSDAYLRFFPSEYIKKHINSAQRPVVITEEKEGKHNVGKMKQLDSSNKQFQHEISIAVLKEIIDRYDQNRSSYSFFSRTPDVLDGLKQLIKKSPATSTSVMRSDVEACLVDNKKFRHLQFRQWFNYLYYNPRTKHPLTSFQRLVYELADAFRNGSPTDKQLSLSKYKG